MSATADDDTSAYPQGPAPFTASPKNTADATRPLVTGTESPRMSRRGTAPRTTFEHSRAASNTLGSPGLSRAGSRRSALARRATSLFQPERKLAPAPPFWKGFKAILFASWFNVLLLFIPVSWAMHFAMPDSYILVFVFSFLAIVPLAKLLAFATDELSMRTGQTIAGLLNATLGNAVELIVAIIALAKCELQIVQASLVGSILSNLLLVLGMCFFAGGTRFSEQGFGLGAAQVNSSLLMIAVIAVLLPGAFDLAIVIVNPDGRKADPDYQKDVLHLSHGLALILLVIYGAYLTFQLVSHAHMYEDNDVTESRTYNHPGQRHLKNMIPFRHRQDVGNGNGAAANGGDDVEGSPHAEEAEEEEEEVPQTSLVQALVLLAVVTVLVAVTAEFLVDSVDGLTIKGNISKEFVSIILLAIVGNAAEHVTAVTVSVKDKLTLSIGVAVGSSIQIALFVIPFIITLGWIMGHPLTLLFDPLESIVLFLAVITVNYTVADGRSNWLEGAILCCLYVMVAVIFWYYPGTDPSVRYESLTCNPRTR